jgi:hypothetical protein
MLDVLRLRVVLASLRLEPFDGRIKAVDLSYLAVSIGDIADTGLARASAEELDRDYDLRILFERLQFMSQVHVAALSKFCTTRVTGTDFAPSPQR